MNKSMKKYFFLFVGPTLIAFFIAFIIPFVMGLYLSFWENIPSGASIIFFSIVIYAVCKVGKSLWTYRRRKQNIIQKNI